MTLVDLIAELRRDHQQFFKQLDTLDRLADQRGSADPVLIKSEIALLAEGLRRHAQQEDHEFFPAFRQLPDLPADLFSDTFFTHLDAEHRGIEDYLQRLLAMQTQTPLPFHWPQTYALLARSLRSHFRKEEEQIFSVVCS